MGKWDGEPQNETEGGRGKQNGRPIILKFKRGKGVMEPCEPAAPSSDGDVSSPRTRGRTRGKQRARSDDPPA